MELNAAQLVRTLLGENAALLEDRIDDLVKRYADAKIERRDIENLIRFDPTQNKKYLPWIVKQQVERKLGLHDLDALHDMLMEFERLIVLPAFQGNRDIYSYSLEDFQRTVTANAELRSQSEKERLAKAAKKRGPVDKPPTEGVKKVSEAGNLEVLEFTDAVSLSWWAWQAYKRENPNWGRPTIEPPPPGVDPYTRDRKWCVRNPTHGLNYMRREPFYMVMKDGWPYVGILLSQGQVKTLDNDIVTMGVAEEIYPVMEPVIAAMKEDGGTLGHESKIFENMRFLFGNVQPGESFGSSVDLSGSSLSSLPSGLHFAQNLDVSKTNLTEIPDDLSVSGDFNAFGTPISKVGKNLTVKGSLDLRQTALTEVPAGVSPKNLDITGTQITELPENLEVDNLHIAGTPITKLPETLRAERMTWSKPLDISECKRLFFRMNLEKLEREFRVHPKFKDISTQAVDKRWAAFKPRLLTYYLTDPVIDGHVKSVYVHTKSGDLE
jgi:hypothetical protein